MRIRVLSLSLLAITACSPPSTKPDAKAETPNKTATEGKKAIVEVTQADEARTITKDIVTSIFTLDAKSDPVQDQVAQALDKKGDHVFRDRKTAGQPIIKVVLYDKGLTDAGLKELAPLKQLQTLAFARITLAES